MSHNNTEIIFGSDTSLAMFKDVIRLALQNMDCGGISDEALTTAANMIWESFTSDDKSRHMDPADHQEMEINAQTSGNSQDVSASGNNCGDLSGSF